MKKAVIYARYSSDNQDDASIETQLRECQQKAKLLDAVVIREYCDMAQSGRTDSREQFRQMLHDAKLKGFQFVIVRKFDRFARNVLDARLTEQHLEKYGIKLISCHESFDDSTSAGWFSKQMVHLVNEWYSRNLATETISGMETNTRKGFRCGGTAPYGYKNVKVLDASTGKMRTKLEIEENEAEAVSIVFKLYSEGKSLKKIIEELTGRHFLPRKAKQWNKSAITQMVRNDVYIGTITWRKGKNPDDWIKTENAAPEIIDSETWEKCQAIARKNKKASIRTRTSVHPLSGMIKCGVCGSSFIVHSKQRGKWRYYCSGYVRKNGCDNTATVFEDVLIGKVKERLLNELITEDRIYKALQQLKKEMTGDTKQLKQKLSQLKADLDKIENKQINLIEEMASGDLPKKIVSAAIEKSEKEKSGIEKRLFDVQGEIDQAENLKITPEDIALFTSISKSSLDTSSPENLKAVFRRLNVSIKINRKAAKITITPDLMTRGIVKLSAGDGILNKTTIFLSATIKLKRAS